MDGAFWADFEDVTDFEDVDFGLRAALEAAERVFFIGTEGIADPSFCFCRLFGVEFMRSSKWNLSFLGCEVCTASRVLTPLVYCRKRCHLLSSGDITGIGAGTVGRPRKLMFSTST